MQCLTFNSLSHYSVKENSNTGILKVIYTGENFLAEFKSLFTLGHPRMDVSCAQLGSRAGLGAARIPHSIHHLLSRTHSCGLEA